jgi:hypothetical protein
MNRSSQVIGSESLLNEGFRKENWTKADGMGASILTAHRKTSGLWERPTSFMYWKTISAPIRCSNEHHLSNCRHRSGAGTEFLPGCLPCGLPCCSMLVPRLHGSGRVVHQASPEFSCPKFVESEPEGRRKESI